MRLLLRHVTLLLPLVLACTSPAAPEPGQAWGGPEASLTLTPAGGAVSYPCGAGTIDSGWTIGRGGQFAATGQHFFGGGPLPPQGRAPHPARYSGQVSGTVLTLTVIVTDTPDTLGLFRLVRGGPAVAEQCL